MIPILLTLLIYIVLDHPFRANERARPLPVVLTVRLLWILMLVWTVGLLIREITG